MEDFYFIVSIIVLIALLLFFFKFLRMATLVENLAYDLHDMRRYLTKPSSGEKARQAFIAGNKELAKYYLELGIYRNIQDHIKRDSRKTPFSSGFNTLKKEYSSYYEEFGFAQPDWEKLKDKDFVAKNDYRVVY